MAMYLRGNFEVYFWLNAFKKSTDVFENLYLQNLSNVKQIFFFLFSIGISSPDNAYVYWAPPSMVALGEWLLSYSWSSFLRS